MRYTQARENIRTFLDTAYKYTNVYSIEYLTILFVLLRDSTTTIIFVKFESVCTYTRCLA